MDSAHRVSQRKKGITLPPWTAFQMDLGTVHTEVGRYSS